MVRMRRFHPMVVPAAMLVVVACVSMVAESANTSTMRTTASVVRGKLEISGPAGTVDLRTRQPVGAVSLTPDGDKVAFASGEPIQEAGGGVAGQVAVADSSDGRLLARTNLGRGIVTGVNLSRDGRRVAFVKDYQELWVMKADGTSLRKIADAGALAPVPGSTLFDPAFTPNGEAIYFGVVEQTFFGEDDKLDNIWKSSLDGEASRVTHFSTPEGPRSWRVVRGPLPLGHGKVLFTTGRSTDRTWEVARVGRSGKTTSLGPVPSMTKALGVSTREITLETLDNRTGTYDLYTMSLRGGGVGWGRWCSAGCRTIDRGIDAGAVSFAGGGGGF